MPSTGFLGSLDHVTGPAASPRRLHAAVLRDLREELPGPEQRAPLRPVCGGQHRAGRPRAPQEGERVLPQQLLWRRLPVPGTAEQAQDDARTQRVRDRLRGQLSSDRATAQLGFGLGLGPECQPQGRSVTRTASISWCPWGVLHPKQGLHPCPGTAGDLVGVRSEIPRVET